MTLRPWICLLLLLAAPACGESPADQLARLNEALRNGSSEERILAAEEVARLGRGGPKTTFALVGILSEKPGDEAERAVARKALLAIGEEAVPALSNALYDEDPTARERALEVISELGPRGAAAVPDLLYLTRAADERVREPAHEVILGMGEAAIPQLIAILNRWDWQERAPAVKCLLELGPAVIDQITPLLEDPSRRGGALDFLMISDSLAGLDPADLESSLTAADAPIRLVAVGALAKLDADWELTLPLLVRALEDEDVRVVMEALRHLEKSVYRGDRHRSEPAASEIAALLTHQDGDVRRRAATILGTIVKSPSPEVLYALLAAAEDDYPWVRAAAQKTLQRIARGRQECLDILIRGLSDPDLQVRVTSAEAIRPYGERAAGAVPALVEALKATPEDGRADEPWAGWLRTAAARALRQIGPGARNAIPDLLDLLEHERTEVAEAAASVLAGLKAQLTTEQCFAALRLPRPRDYFLEVLLVRAYRDERFMAELLAFLPEHPELRDTVADCMGSTGPEAAPLVPYILKAVLERGVADYTTVQALKGKGEAAIRPIREALSTTTDPARRLTLLYLLHALDADEGEFFVEAEKAVAAPDAGLRSAGARAVGTAGQGHDNAVPILVKLLTDENREVRLAALYALWEMGDAAKAALPTLRKIVADGEDGRLEAEAAELIRELEGED
jgi:HEAT repeat protein